MRDSPEVIKGTKFFAESDCEELISITAARARKLKLRQGSRFVTTKRGQYGQFNVFRLSDFEPIPNRTSVPAKKIDVLQATFTLNKSAKRYRDPASSNYDKKQYGFATCAKNKKEELYALKEQGISKAFSAGRLKFMGLHGGLGIYRGEGYCFHSTLLLRDLIEVLTVQADRVFIESCPKGTSEARLKDAIYTLTDCAVDESQFKRLKPPRHAKSKKDHHYNARTESGSLNDSEFDDEYEFDDEGY
jgi:hypothetical protein